MSSTNSVWSSTNSVWFYAALSTLLATWPQSSGVVIRLVDVAEQAGITLLNICGGRSKDYLRPTVSWRSSSRDAGLGSEIVYGAERRGVGSIGPGALQNETTVSN